MKKLIWILVIAVMLSAAEKSRAVRAVEKGYQNWGVGGGLSFVVPDNGKGLYYANQDGGLGFEFKGVVRFSLGKAGSVHYTPSINWWGRIDKWGNEAHNTDVSLYDWELNINLFDARYVPPVPKDLIVKPYVGVGLLAFSVYKFKEEIGFNHQYWYRDHYYYDSYYAQYGYYNKDTDFSLASNFFVGAEFEVSDAFWPYFELKLSSGNVNEFIMTAGFTIQGRK